MAQQVPVSQDAVIDPSKGDGQHELTADLAYLRTAIVNVMFLGPAGAPDRGWVLIDAGIMGSAGAIKAATQARFGLGSRPAAIVLTHGHFDHVGALGTLAEAWDVPVDARPREPPYLDGSAAYPPADPFVGGGLMALLSPLSPTKPVDVSSRLRDLPVDGAVPFMPCWRWPHVPGHAPGQVALWREQDRTLIAADAIVTTAQGSAYSVVLQEPELHGPPRYFTVDWAAARASVENLAGLDPERVITGHGRPMQGPSMRAALAVLAREFDERAVPEHGTYVDHPARADDGSAYRKP